MFTFIKRRLKNQKGAMDRVIVTLLLVIVGVTAFVGLSTWIDTNVDSVKNSASSTVTNTTTAISN